MCDFVSVNHSGTFSRWSSGKQVPAFHVKSMLADRYEAQPSGSFSEVTGPGTWAGRINGTITLHRDVVVVIEWV